MIPPTYNDLIGRIAERLRTLGNLSMDQLRLEAGYGCDNRTQAREMNARLTRGELLENIIVEEFSADSNFELGGDT